MYPSLSFFLPMNGLACSLVATWVLAWYPVPLQLLQWSSWRGSAFGWLGAAGSKLCGGTLLQNLQPRVGPTVPVVKCEEYVRLLSLRTSISFIDGTSLNFLVGLFCRMIRSC